MPGRFPAFSNVRDFDRTVGIRPTAAEEFVLLRDKAPRR